MSNKEIIQKIRKMMCSGELYNPIFWDYYRENGNYDEAETKAAIMNEYQRKCRHAMMQYNTLTIDDQEKKQELLTEIFGQFDGFRNIEAPFHANYGGKHTKLLGVFYANLNLTLIEDGEIEIGDKTMIGPNVTICTAEHPKDILIRSLGQGILYNKKITIGSNVWIGANVTILAGATIGDNCIIGAGTIITKDSFIPAGKIAIGIVNKHNASQLKNID